MAKQDVRVKTALVVTTISGPQKVLKSLAVGCKREGWDFVVVGDVASPPDFKLAGCDYYSLERQLQTGLKTAKQCPKKHYARKNIGYLMAMRQGAGIIVETDDDNLPLNSFWEARDRSQDARLLTTPGWVNVYSYFTAKNIWPRGLPLTDIHQHIVPGKLKAKGPVCCPIQQGLADDNPDVDAIYRLALPLPVRFDKKSSIALGKGTWSPFNSQNTTWWREAFPLLYLPAYCSFRMTDIWRSYIAQRIAWENGWQVLFHQATVTQQRNEHNLLKDFADEVPGYLQAGNIQKLLSELKVRKGVKQLPDMLRLCYSHLVRNSIMDARELTLLEAWIKDLNSFSEV